MYFVLIMEKVQTGQVIEFYSNSCQVKTNFGEFSCIAIKNVVVGDFVEFEIIQDSKQLQGKIIKIQDRISKLSKRDGLGIWETEGFEVKSSKDSRVLLMEVPMQW